MTAVRTAAGENGSFSLGGVSVAMSFGKTS